VEALSEVEGLANNSSAGQQVTVKLLIYDILGRQVDILVNESQPPGNYSIQFNASHLASGVYFYSLQTNEFFQTKKMLVLK